MKTKSIIQFVMTTFFCMLFGCYSPTVYAPENRWDMGTKVQGYRDTKIASDQFQVSFIGNTKTGDQTAYSYCLYRCAEVTKEFPEGAKMKPPRGSLSIPLRTSHLLFSYLSTTIESH